MMDTLTRHHTLVTAGVETRKFNPAQPRDPGGQGGGQWIRDVLKLLGRMDLDPGEQLVGSDVIESDDGDLLAAWTDGPAGPRLRLGIGIGDEDRNRWRGRNLGGTVLLDPPAVGRLRAAVDEMDTAAAARIPEARAMEAEIGKLEARRRELVRRQYKGLPKSNVRELDKIEERIEYLDGRIASIAADVAERQGRLDRETDPEEQRFLTGMNNNRRGEAALHARERDLLVARREEIAGRGTALSPDEIAEIRRLRAEIAAMWTRWHEFRERDMASGSIPTPWGNLTYGADLDEDLEPSFGLNIEGSNADDVRLTRKNLAALRALLARIVAGDSTRTKQFDDTVTRHRQLVMLGVVRTMVDVDDDPYELDEVSAAIVDALDAFDETRAARKPLRIPEGFEGGGRFRSVSDVVFKALKDWAEGKGPDNPFDGLKDTLDSDPAKRREQLRRAAKARGITLRRGATENEIANALLDDVRPGRKGKDAVAPDEKPVKKAAPKKAPAKKTVPKRRIDRDAEVDVGLAVTGADPEIDAMTKRFKAGEIDAAEFARLLTEHGRRRREAEDKAAGRDKPGNVFNPTEHMGGKPDRESLARQRQADIDTAQNYAAVAGELAEYLDAEADPEVVARRLRQEGRKRGIADEVEPIAAAVEGGGGGARVRVSDLRPGDMVPSLDPADDEPREVTHISKVAGGDLVVHYRDLRRKQGGTGAIRLEGDMEVDVASRPTDARALAAALLADHGITQDGAARDSGRFTPSQHTPIGAPIRQGAPVEVVRPGFTLTRDGERIRIAKAVVEEAGEAPDDPMASFRQAQQVRRDRREAVGITGDPTEADARIILSRLSRAQLKKAFERTNTKYVLSDRDSVFKLGDQQGKAFGTSGTDEELREALIAEVVGQARRRDGDAGPSFAHAELVDVALEIDPPKLGSGEVGPVDSGADSLSSLRTLDPEAARDALDLKKVPELKAMLRDAGLPVGGRKRELVDRLVGHVHPGGGAEAEAVPAARNLDDDAPSGPFEPVPKSSLTRDERIRQLVAQGMTWKQAREQVKREPRSADDMDAETRDRVLALAEMRFADEMRAMDDNQLKRYWTVGEGLKRWRFKPHPWTTLRNLLRKHVGPGRAERMASEWFKVVFGYWPGSRKGDNPVGPG